MTAKEALQQRVGRHDRRRGRNAAPAGRAEPTPDERAEAAEAAPPSAPRPKQKKAERARPKPRTEEVEAPPPAPLGLWSRIKRFFGG